MYLKLLRSSQCDHRPRFSATGLRRYVERAATLYNFEQHTASPVVPYMRICIVAEHASTIFGGEAIIPIHYFRLLRSLGVESWLVVHVRTRSELAKLFPHDLDRILYVPDLWIHKLLSYLSPYLPRRLSEATIGLFNQLITQFFQRAIVRQLIHDKRIDVIHQPIPVAPRFPS